MSSEFKEEFIEEEDKVLCRRIYPLIPNKSVTVEMYVTKAYLTDTDGDIVKRYLDQTAAAILTRNGVEDAN